MIVRTYATPEAFKGAIQMGLAQRGLIALESACHEPCASLRR